MEIRFWQIASNFGGVRSSHMSLPSGPCDCEAAAAVREELAEWRTVAIAALALALPSICVSLGCAVSWVLRWSRRRELDAKGIGCTLRPPKTRVTPRWDRYAAFVSHYKIEAGTDARYLVELLEASTDNPCFLDSSELTHLSEIFSGVEQSSVLLVLGTPGLLLRPWCLLEIWHAHTISKPIVLMPIENSGFTRQGAEHTLRNLESELEAKSPGALQLIKKQLSQRCCCAPAPALVSGCWMLPSLKKCALPAPRHQVLPLRQLQAQPRGGIEAEPRRHRVP